MDEIDQSGLPEGLRNDRFDLERRKCLLCLGLTRKVSLKRLPHSPRFLGDFPAWVE